MGTPAHRYERMCRTCMMEGQHLSSIFEDVEGPFKICEMLSSLAPQLLILSSDLLPQKLCEACLNKLNIAYEFQQMCINSERHMRNALTKESELLCNPVPLIIQSSFSLEEDPLLDELIKLQECIKTETQDNVEIMLAQIAYPSGAQQIDAITSELDIKPMDAIERTVADCTETDDPASSHTNSSSKRNGEFGTLNVHHVSGVFQIEKPVMINREKLKCPHCVATFDRPYNLNRHITVHSEDRQFLCDICNYRFSTSSLLMRHKSLHERNEETANNLLPAEGFKCTECPRHFERINSLAAHMQVHRKMNANQVYECNLCQKKYHKFGELSRHLRNHPENQKYKCTVCEKKFGLKSHLTEHMNKHYGLKTFACVTCNKEFENQSKLLAHQRTHTSEKSFLCAECGKSFYNKNNLREHLARHSGQRPHQCPECPSKFSCSSDLIKHMSTHREFKPFECEICKSQFTRSYSLKKHKAIHTGERPFKCDICNMTFVFRNIMLKHQRTHTGEKPYKCKLCSRDYSESGDLNKHMRSHLGRKLYKCEQCPEAFKFKMDLRDHIRMHYKQQKQKEKEEAQAAAEIAVENVDA